MKNKWKWFFFIILVLLFSVAGYLYNYKDKLIARYIPKLEQIGDLEINVGDDTTYIHSKLVIENNSFLKIGVDTIKYQVSLFNKTYLKSQSFLGIVLPPNGKDTFEFSLKIPYKEILKDLKAERKKGDSASYAIHVFLQYSTVLGKAELPINKVAKLKIPQPPELEIENVKYTKIRFKNIEASAKIKIINYGPITLSIKEMAYVLVVPNQGTLKGKYFEAIKIKPFGTTVVTLPIKVTLKNIFRTAIQVARNKDQYEYNLSLLAVLEPEDSLKKPIRIHLTKMGIMELRK